MSIEDRLASGIAEGVDRAGLEPGDLAVAVARGGRIRRRRRALVVGGASALVVVVALTTSLVSGGRSREAPADPATPAGQATWTRASDGPLSPRYGPLTIGLDGVLLVMGGHDGSPCPPNADCDMPDDNPGDAAAYDVRRDVWTDIADPPVEVDQFSAAVVVDGVVVLGVGERWWRYDLAVDEWAGLPGPGAVTTGPQAVGDGLVYARGFDAGSRDVWVLDVEAGSWSRLPTDPLVPPLFDATVFATDAGVVLTGVNYEEAAPDEPTLTQADVWDGTRWTRLPRTGMIGPLYHWTGERLVGLEVGGADGGEVNGWDRSYPYGGSLDPTTGEWAPVPGLPLDHGQLSGLSWTVEAADGPLVATQGRVYDDRTQTWLDLGRPDSPVDSELTGAWVDARLLVFGGYDEDTPDRGPEGLSGATWIWSPAGAEPTESSEPAGASVGDPAVWMLRAGTSPGPETRALTLDVSRLGCNNRVTGEVLEPAVTYADTEVTITFQVERELDGGDCPSNKPETYDLTLDEPLGDRSLVDGACLPGAEAATTSWCAPDGVRSRPDS